MRRTSISITFALLALAASLAGDDALAYRVIVNSANPVNEARRSQVSEIFLKRVVHWPNGQPAAPVDQSITFPIRERFSKQVHGRSALAVQHYWQQQIFSGRGVPPPVRLTDQEVIAFVKASAGAIGYVSAETSLPDSTRTLKLVE